MRCPKCGTECLPTERYCDCGYDFTLKSVNEAKRSPDQGFKVLSRDYQILLWVLAFVGGILGIILCGSVMSGKYDNDSKNKARPIFVVSCIFMVFSVVLPMLLRMVLK
jgi:hypothetical protein